MIHLDRLLLNRRGRERMINAAKMTDERETPLELFEPLHAEFNFDVDVAAMYNNTKLPKYFHIGDSGLKQEWAPMRCFMNPPYSEIPRWLDKATVEMNKGALIVAILPIDSSTRWFHNYIWDESKNNWRNGIKVRFPSKRFKFDKYANSAKFATMIAIMNHELGK